MDLLSFITWCIFFFIVAHAIGQPASIAFSETEGGLKLGGTGLGPTILIDSKDWAGVTRAGNDLANDFGLVTGADGKVVSSSSGLAGTPVIIAGTTVFHYLLPKPSRTFADSGFFQAQWGNLP